MTDPMQILSKTELDLLHKGAMEVLEKTGVIFHHEGALEKFKAHGVKVDGKRVMPTEEQVMAALATAPRRFTMHGRNPDHDIDVGGSGTALAPGYGAPFVIDGNGDKRAATMDDYRNFLKLAQSSGQVDMAGFLIVEPCDLAPKTGHLDMLQTTMLMSDKPFISCPLSEGTLADNIAMANILFGGEKAIDGHPVMMPTINPLSPLQYSEEMAGALMGHAQWGQPVAVTNVVMAGTSGPVRPAGTMVISMAEVLVGLMLSQLVRPGSPAMMGNQSCPTDMRTGMTALGSPETCNFYRAGIQVARYYDLPTRIGGAMTDSYLADVRGGMEAALLMVSSMATDTDIIYHAFGIVGSYLAMSYEKFLVDEELAAMIRKFLKPMEITEEALSLETIHRIGHGGTFLMEMETLRRCRTEFHAPLLAERRSYGEWAEAGKLRAEDEAMAKLPARLESYTRPDIDPGVEKDLEAYVERRKAELG